VKKRETTEEERALFQSVIAGKVILTRPRRLNLDSAAPIKPMAKRPQVPSGINGRTSEKLERGEIYPDAKIDLHGMTEAVAYRALARFITASAQRGCKLVLVVTGKGEKPADPYAPFDMELDARSRGVLRSMTPRWLAEPALVRLIADVRFAHARHGGSGALYVYLRKKAVR
jgi:DNA-nicking Smr family endonuclease